MLLILPLFICINMLQPNTTFKTDTPLRDPTLNSLHIVFLKFVDILTL
jgi:hypothetical protein